MESAVYSQQVSLRLDQVAAHLTELVEGKLVFSSTETWRSLYEKVLESCQAKRYLSVALIRSEDYWRDAPGESSLEFNYGLVTRGFHIHRVFVIDEFFWPPSARTPSKQLFQWILSQHHGGIEVSLLRLTDLDDEPSLICDMGIYGQEAVGMQQTDFEGKTVRFELCFDSNSLMQAEQRWLQILSFAKSLHDIIDVPV
jgi:hypothetical protein